jgi:ABC-type multidrug transport system fused ATPase/permease subunit
MPLKNLLRLIRHLNTKHKIKFIWLILLILIVSLAELATIGAIIPFLATLSSGKIAEKSIYSGASSYFNFHLNSIAIIGFCVLAIISGILRIYFFKASARYSFNIGSELSSNAYKKYINQPYFDQIGQNSSHIVSVVTTKTTGATYAINAYVSLFANLILMTVMLTAAYIYAPLDSIYFVLFFIVVYGIIIIIVRNRLESNSLIIAESLSKQIKLVQESVGGVRDLILEQLHDKFANQYSTLDHGLKKAQYEIEYIGASPKYLLETFGIVTLCLIAYFNSNSKDGIGEVLPILGVIALTAQRLLPVMQQTYSAWAVIKGSSGNVREVLEILEVDSKFSNEKIGYESLNFVHSIVLDNVSFQYDENLPKTLAGINIKINKNTCVGIVGKSGSGKSTLIDIISGLLMPTEGAIYVDEVKVQKENIGSLYKKIAYVPQNFYLSDNTILENIGYGSSVHSIDKSRVDSVIKKVDLQKDIEKMPLGVMTLVGERGVRLSGGQKQRIAIARALYKNASIIILDEVSSALDSNTEAEVMKTIEQLSAELTVIIISHRLSTLSICTNVYKIEDTLIQEVNLSEINK